MSVYRSNDNWFRLPAGCYCGVFIKERSAKKLQKLLWRQTQEIKDFLTANKEDLVPEAWTLAYPLPEKKQTVVHYVDTDDSVESRIALFDKADRLQHIDDLFFTDKRYNEARKDVQNFYEEMYEDVDGRADNGE